jgi:hypothetical protein
MSIKLQIDVDVTNEAGALDALANIYKSIEDGATKDEVVVAGEVVGVFEILEPAA